MNKLIININGKEQRIGIGYWWYKFNETYLVWAGSVLAHFTLRFDSEKAQSINDSRLATSTQIRKPFYIFILLVVVFSMKKIIILFQLFFV